MYRNSNFDTNETVLPTTRNRLFDFRLKNRLVAKFTWKGQVLKVILKSGNGGISETRVWTLNVNRETLDLKVNVTKSCPQKNEETRYYSGCSCAFEIASSGVTRGRILMLECAFRGKNMRPVLISHRPISEAVKVRCVATSRKSPPSRMTLCHCSCST